VAWEPARRGAAPRRSMQMSAPARAPRRPPVAGRVQVGFEVEGVALVGDLEGGGAGSSTRTPPATGGWAQGGCMETRAHGRRGWHRGTSVWMQRCRAERGGEASGGGGGAYVVIGCLKVIHKLGNGQLLRAGEEVKGGEVERASGRVLGDLGQVQVEEPGRFRGSKRSEGQSGGMERGRRNTRPVVWQQWSRAGR
jgi:hypothetical protein